MYLLIIYIKYTFIMVMNKNWISFKSFEFTASFFIMYFLN